MRTFLARLLVALCFALPVMASEVSTWSTTSDNNNSSPPNGWPEGMNYSQVNNSAREMMGAIARWRDGFTVPGVTVSGAAATNRVVYWNTGSATRWGMYADPAAESGSNAGSNFYFYSFNDAGAGLVRIFSVTRSTGVLDFGNPPTLPTSAASDNSTKAATTAWVRNYAPSAVFTPSTGNNSNVLTAGAGYGTYIRVGNIVHVSIRQPSTPSSAGGCSFTVALPIGSNITSVDQVSGVGYSLNALAPDTVTVQGVVANPGRVIIAWTASGTSAGHTNIQFSYEVH